MLNQYGYVCSRFDQVAQDSGMEVSLPAKTFRGRAVAVAVDPSFPELSLIAPVVGLEAGEIEFGLWRAGQAYDRNGQPISVVYGRDYDLAPVLGNDLVQLASREPTHSICVNAYLLTKALRMYEDGPVELSLVKPESPDHEPWEALIVTRPGSEAANTAVITPIATLTNTGRHGTDAPRSESVPPRPTHPGSPWLNASIPDEDPDDGDKCWLAIKGRKNWMAIAARWDEGRSEWLTLDGRYVFGFINHRDVECYHCPMSEFPGQVEAFDFLN